MLSAWSTRPRRVAAHQFGGAAPRIHHQHRVAVQPSARDRASEGQFGLLVPTDQFQFDAHALAHGEELVAVRGVAGTPTWPRIAPACSRACGSAALFVDRRPSPGDGFVVQAPGRVHPMAEPDEPQLALKFTQRPDVPGRIVDAGDVQPQACWCQRPAQQLSQSSQCSSVLQGPSQNSPISLSASSPNGFTPHRPPARHGRPAHAGASPG